MFTLICCSLAGLKMSLRTGFCCKNFLAQDKIKARRKLYLSLPHIGILGVPSPNCMLRLQFWDGALLPPAVLGWHLLTCNILPPDLRWHLLTSNILPPDVRWHLLTCNILPADLRWHLLTCNILPPDVRWHLLTCNIFHLPVCGMAPSQLQILSPASICYGTFSPAIFYRQICDGTFSPAIFLPADLRWHLLTCNILPPDVRWHLLTLKMFFTGRFAMAPSHLENVFYRQICDSTFSPAIFYRQICDGTFSPAIFYRQMLQWRLLTLNFFSCRFGTAPSHLQFFSPADLAWHLPGLPNAPKNKNDQAKIQIQTEIIETTMKSASAQTKISYSIQNIQTLLKTTKLCENHPEKKSKCTATQLYHHKCHNCHKYHKIRQYP